MNYLTWIFRIFSSFSTSLVCNWHSFITKTRRKISSPILSHINWNTLHFDAKFDKKKTLNKSSPLLQCEFTRINYVFQTLPNITLFWSVYDLLIFTFAKHFMLFASRFVVSTEQYTIFSINMENFLVQFASNQTSIK